jgi:CRISPR system Cascade subunit CasC
MSQPFFVEVHILQSVPPSNINRDDTGSPKSAVFGGVRRARVSSQAWKKASRDAFRRDIADTGVTDSLTPAPVWMKLPVQQRVASRTKHAADMIAASIIRQRPDLSGIAEQLAEEVLRKTLAVKAAKEKDVLDSENNTKYLLFISADQASKLGELAINAHSQEMALDPKQAKAILNQDNAFDIALFGRMVADDPSLNVDAACQVAHAIGIHRSDTEFDYFTAVDDMSPDDNAGAGMIGTIEFTSSTLYRYATVDVPHLRENLGSDEATVRAVQAFVDAFVTSMPAGKQNTFANRTLPSAVVVQVRHTQPVSLVTAFEEPIESRDGKGRLQLACEALVAQEQRLDEAFGVAPTRTWVITAAPHTEALEQLGSVVSLARLIEELGDVVAKTGQFDPDASSSERDSGVSA